MKRGAGQKKSPASRNERQRYMKMVIKMPKITIFAKEDWEEKSALVFCLAAKKYTDIYDVDELCDNVLKIVTNKEDDIPTETDEEIEKYKGARYVILYFMTFLEEVYDYSYPDAEDIPLLKKLLYKAKDTDIEEIKEKLKNF